MGTLPTHLSFITKKVAVPMPSALIFLVLPFLLAQFRLSQLGYVYLSLCSQ
nr:hypothetical protein Q903MT_gene1533 [Picea sitchensis]